MSSSGDAPTRLARRLGTTDAVVIGLGAMIGAGVFAAVGPAAAAAGGGMVLGLGLAAVIAYANATSSARLAAVHPASGGTYAYGRHQLGRYWGFLAGWGFVVGKTASCAAMALTFAAYAAPSVARPLAAAAVVAITAVNLGGVRKTARLTAAIVVVVLAALAVVVIAGLVGGSPSAETVGPILAASPTQVLQSAGLLFFAFAGYARIATLGEEVRDPARTIRRAVPVALGITVVVYAAVVATALLTIGPDAMAAATAPLAEVVRAGDLAGLAPVVRVGAVVASLGVLLSLVAGVSRTTFAMAAEGDLPRWLDAVDARRHVPHRAELLVGALVLAVVLVADVRGAIGFSAFTVLGYYAITNAAALTLGTGQRPPRPLAVLGLVGCVVLAASLPAGSVVGGVAVLAAGSLAWLLGPRRRR